MFGSRTLTFLILAALVGCGRPEAWRPGVDAERALAQGRAYAAELVASGRAGGAGDAEVVALGYLERLRLGLGSPFRLIDFALHDPRLPDAARVELANALLARTLDGHAYEVSVSTLDRLSPAAPEARVGTGRYHLELIEDAVAEAPDPRSGELAVRLAYALAGAERSVSRRGPGMAAQAASLVRDRELARADAERLVRSAREEGVDPARLVPRWRRERRFEVERPPLLPLAGEAERAAMDLAPRLATAIRGVAPRTGGAGVGRDAPSPLLGRAVARRLAELADSLNAPPQTPVVVAVEMYEADLLERPELPDAALAARRRLVERASNEERFAAEYALLTSGPGGGGSAPGAVALQAASALRSYGQEKVWFPGWGGPTARELEGIFGLASVDFGEDVPASWRPYYRRMLAQALGDLQRALPALSLRGVSIHFGSSPSAGTLALHDPRRRRIYLPPRTGAGTIAHEVAHDLDWQAALRFYDVRGDYGTDRALQHRRNGRLTGAVQALNTAVLRSSTRSAHEPEAHWRRPAEVFARSVEWLVAASLAREGRMNGYLSSVQDDLLTGYGTVAPPDVSGSAGAALITILDEVAPLYPGAREWFLESYGRARALTAYDLVRRVVEAPVGTGASRAIDGPEAARTRPGLPGPEEAEARGPAAPYALTAPATVFEVFGDVERARDSALDALETWICRSPGAVFDPSLESARRRLVVAAAGARARGVAIALAGETTGPVAGRWLARQFFGGPWPDTPVDRAVAEHLAPLVQYVRRFGEGQVQGAGGSFRVRSAGARCAADVLRVAG